MNVNTKKTKKAEWLVPAALVVLSMIPVIAGTARIVELTSGSEITPDNARFFASPIPVVVHILSVTLYSLLGAFQFAPSFRRRKPGWHRAAGRILVPSGLAAALSGLWMSQFYTLPESDGELLYVFRLLFGAAMLMSIILGGFAVRRKDYAAHGEWMMRGYAIGLGAGTQVLTHLPWLILMDSTPGEFPRAMMMGAGWVINILVAEWIIRKRREQRAEKTHQRRTSLISAQETI